MLGLDREVAQGNALALVLEDQRPFGVDLTLAEDRVEVAAEDRQDEGTAPARGGTAGDQLHSVSLQEAGKALVEVELRRSRAKRVIGAVGRRGRHEEAGKDGGCGDALHSLTAQVLFTVAPSGGRPAKENSA